MSAGGAIFDGVWSMVFSFLSWLAPVLFGLGALVLGVVLVAVGLWLRAPEDPDPIPHIDRTKSDWLGQP